MGAQLGQQTAGTADALEADRHRRAPRQELQNPPLRPGSHGRGADGEDLGGLGDLDGGLLAQPALQLGEGLLGCLDPAADLRGVLEPLASSSAPVASSMLTKVATIWRCIVFTVMQRSLTGLSDYEGNLERLDIDIVPL